MRLKQRRAFAAAAWLRGMEGGPNATAWLDRAARLAPEDPRIALDLARARLAGNPSFAEAAFAQIAKTHDVVQAWLGLAMARRRLGDTAGAAAALAPILTRHCLPAEPGFLAVAADLAGAAGFRGFRGVRADGEIVTQGEPPFLAENPDFAALGRVVGLVAAQAKGLRGWAARPAAPGAPPQVTLTDANGQTLKIRFGKPLKADNDAPLLPRYRFSIPYARLAGFTPPFSLSPPDGSHLMGSPLDPAWLQIPPVPAAWRGPPVTKLPDRQNLAILIPVYRGLAETQACLGSLAVDAEIIVIDDATPEPALAAWLDEQSASGRLTLLRHASNRGFAAAVNTGLQAAAGRDVVLLNSDTLVPPGAIERLHGLAYGHPATASVTPLSNQATILSIPDPAGNAAPDLAGAARLGRLAGRANGLKTHEIPTGIGFCMLLRHDALKAAGGFRPEIFAQGYGEENDWCMRARHLGYRHQAALGVYVAHIGGVSFGAAASGLIARNLAILNRLFPGYHELVMDFIAADPLRRTRAAIDILALKTANQDSVLLISHSHGGGVARQVAADAVALRAQGLRPLFLTTQFPDDPVKTPYPWPARLTADDWDTPNLVFTLPAQRPELRRLLQALRVQKTVLHHALGHHPGVRDLAAELGVPQDIVIHDYACFCPRVNLLAPGPPPRYCGEPALAGCIACCRRDKAEIYDSTPVPDLLARSARDFAAAAKVITPSADAARRLTRHFPGLVPRITPWEDDNLPVRLRRPRAGARRIVTIGGIGPSKGFDLLADCARDAAARGLPLEFLVAGTSADDQVLLDAGIFITGAYAEGSATELLTGLDADLAFLPSIWPETWCFTLGEAWRAGLYAVTFDLGAQAERIRATGRGLLLPLGLPVARINEILLNYQPP